MKQTRLKEGRYIHTATRLPDGTVLAVGGQDSGVFALASAELYGFPVLLPSTADGRGTFDTDGEQVTFQFHAIQGDQTYLGYFAFCDSNADICTKRGRVGALTTTGNIAACSGFVQLNGRPVTFNATATDNTSSGTPDTISISLSHGYSAAGTINEW